MAASSPIADPDADSEMAARAAWLHYAGGLTQSAVAKRLGLQPTRAHRLISQAARDGLVRVFVDCDVASCIELENTLAERFGLNVCSVVPDVADDPLLPLVSLSQGGSRFLMRVLASREHEVIGIGHGRTLSAVVDALPRRGLEPATYVSLLGGLTRKFAANPYDVIFRLAEKVNAEAYFMPAPMFADSVEDRALMLRQTGLAEVMRHIGTCTLCLLGIGATHVDGTLAMSTVADTGEPQRELRDAGVVAELLGQFLDADGRQVSTPYDNRMMAPTLDSLADKQMVAIAGGQYKHDAILATLRSGLLNGLVTDERTARAIVDHAF